MFTHVYVYQYVCVQILKRHKGMVENHLALEGKKYNCLSSWTATSKFSIFCLPLIATFPLYKVEETTLPPSQKN